jgi:hypothetical protein
MGSRVQRKRPCECTHGRARLGLHFAIEQRDHEEWDRGLELSSVTGGLLLVLFEARGPACRRRLFPYPLSVSRGGMLAGGTSRASSGATSASSGTVAGRSWLTRNTFNGFPILVESVVGVLVRPEN